VPSWRGAFLPTNFVVRSGSFWHTSSQLVDQRNPKNRTQNVSRETFGWLAIVTWGAGCQKTPDKS